MIDVRRCRWIRRWWWRWWWRRWWWRWRRCYCWRRRRRDRRLLLFFPRLDAMVTVTDRSNVSVTRAAPAVGARVAAIATTAASASASAATAPAWTISVLAFSLPLAMHLSRYGRLPSCSIGGCRCRRGYRGGRSGISCRSSPLLLLAQRGLFPCLPQPMLLLQFQSLVHYGRHESEGRGR